MTDYSFDREKDEMKKELYYDGNIITMSGQEKADAVLVENGKILAVGRKDAMNLNGEVQRISLEGIRCCLDS